MRVLMGFSLRFFFCFFFYLVLVLLHTMRIQTLEQFIQWKMSRNQNAMNEKAQKYLLGSIQGTHRKRNGASQIWSLCKLVRTRHQCLLGGDSFRVPINSRHLIDVCCARQNKSPRRAHTVPPMRISKFPQTDRARWTHANSLRVPRSTRIVAANGILCGLCRWNNIIKNFVCTILVKLLG